MFSVTFSEQGRVRDIFWQPSCVLSALWQNTSKGATALLSQPRLRAVERRQKAWCSGTTFQLHIEGWGLSHSTSHWQHSWVYFLVSSISFSSVLKFSLYTFILMFWTMNCYFKNQCLLLEYRKALDFLAVILYTTILLKMFVCLKNLMIVFKVSYV